jgi:hypothetical protein
MNILMETKCRGKKVFQIDVAKGKITYVFMVLYIETYCVK